MVDFGEYRAFLPRDRFAEICANVDELSSKENVLHYGGKKNSVHQIKFTHTAKASDNDDEDDDDSEKHGYAFDKDSQMYFYNEKN